MKNAPNRGGQLSALFGRSLKVKVQCTCDAREARVGRQREARVGPAPREARVFIFRFCFLPLNTMHFENFSSFDFHDVVCVQLQFEMASRYSSKGSERASGFVSEARGSQYNGLSENCVEPGSGESKCGEVVSDSIFLGLGERASGQENLRDESERISESGVVPLAENSIHGASGDLSKTDQGDRSHKRIVSDICPSPVTVRRNGDRRKGNFVTFNPEIIVHLVPYEDRTSEWMQSAIDRAHFRRRIQLFEELFTAL